jgi:Protein of unknown function (DUF4231)
VEIALFKRRPRLRSRFAQPELFPDSSAADYPALEADLDTIAKLLTPAFCDYDLAAQREQNIYWRQQVIVIVIGAFTSAAAAIQAALSKEVWPGVVVALLGGLSAAVAAMARERDAQQGYLDNRTRAERLRAAAFTYLAELPPYIGSDRRTRLASTVAEVAQGQEPQ